MRLLSSVIAAAMLSTSLYAFADTYVYTIYYQSDYLGTKDSATFFEPAIITQPTTITSGIIGASSVVIDPSLNSCQSSSVVESCVEVGYPEGGTLDGTAYAFLYFDTNIESVGYYDDAAFGRSMSIRDVSTLADADFVTPTETNITPEPSSFALLGTGLLGLAGALRRRVV